MNKLSPGHAAILALALLVGCSSSKPTDPGNGGDDSGTGVETDGGGEVSDGGEGDDGGLPVGDGGPGTMCIASGAACDATASNPCCSGNCANGRCAEPQFCDGPGSACTATSNNCCTNNCVNSQCSNVQCLDVGGSCGAPSDCCTGVCTGGQCAALPAAIDAPTCGVLGQACSGAADCCSTNCQGGVCVRAFSCQAYGDICYAGTDCCGGACSGTGGAPGRCQDTQTMGVRNCRQDGVPCIDENDCCTNTCEDLGSGVAVCVPAGGCKVSGNYCSDANQCCGGGANPEGDVQCRSGACDQGMACNDPGNLCSPGFYMDGGTRVISAPNANSCCGGMGGGLSNADTCKVDPGGIPRCYGGQSQQCPSGYVSDDPNCCIGGDQVCQFNDQCCNGSLCLPPGDGGTLLTCQTLSCDPIGTVCTPGSDNCCEGTSCRATSEIEFACQRDVPPGTTDGGTQADGGTSDGGSGTCLSNGSDCASAAVCCSMICSAGKCAVPAVCQPETGACTSGADCCEGLQCTFSGGVGSCTAGGCGSAGQACSNSSSCCSGFGCFTESGANCDGTTACVCQIVIN